MKILVSVLFALAVIGFLSIAPSAYAGDCDKAPVVELLDVGYADVIQLAEVKVEALAPAVRRQTIDNDTEISYQANRRQQLNIGYNLKFASALNASHRSAVSRNAFDAAAPLPVPRL